MDLSAARQLINPEVRGLRAYHLNPEHVSVKLNQNENPFDWPASVKEEVAAFTRTRPWNRYPEFVPGRLNEAVAAYAGVGADQVIVGNGSNEMLLVLLLALSSSTRPLITCQPTFTVYRLLAAGLGRDHEPAYLTDNLAYDIDAILGVREDAPRGVILLCSPNNPTGSALSEEQMRAVLDFHEGFCIVDQAYVEFGGYDATPLLAQYPNLIITRTFSKAFGAAGMRLGYLIGAAEVVAEVRKIKLPYNVNFFSSYAATVLLSHADMARERAAVIVQERDRIGRFLRDIPRLTAFESSANFILIRVPDKDALVRSLRGEDILVRDVSSYPMLDNCLRLSVGTREENDRLMAGLARHYAA
ncbi:MAG: histidinol-phosphate transaminase [Chitinivibrionales bacterium]|nr:histidinol-phosphate transaminase [Chitinivibrionales bacterium]MBD3394170.1 histidinol-phosphate transaminase [Chitinivibrionales bacterium]